MSGIISWPASESSLRLRASAAVYRNARASVAGERSNAMSIRRVEIERFSVTSSKPFESVVAAVKAAVGHLDMVKFTKASKDAQSFA